MFSFGGTEIFILVVVALLLFGPDKIPQLARTIGRFMREFNKYKSIMESTLRQEIYEAEPPKASTTTLEERMNRAAAASSELIAAQNAASAAVPLEGAESVSGVVPGTGVEDSAAGSSRPATPAPDGEAVSAPPSIVTDEGDEEGEG